MGNIKGDTRSLDYSSDAEEVGLPKQSADLRS